MEFSNIFIPIDQDLASKSKRVKSQKIFTSWSKNWRRTKKSRRFPLQEVVRTSKSSSSCKNSLLTKDERMMILVVEILLIKGEVQMVIILTTNKTKTKDFHQIHHHICTIINISLKEQALWILLRKEKCLLLILRRIMTTKMSSNNSIIDHFFKAKIKRKIKNHKEDITHRKSLNMPKKKNIVLILVKDFHHQINIVNIGKIQKTLLLKDSIREMRF